MEYLNSMKHLRDLNACCIYDERHSCSVVTALKLVESMQVWRFEPIWGSVAGASNGLLGWSPLKLKAPSCWYLLRGKLIINLNSQDPGWYSYLAARPEWQTNPRDPTNPVFSPRKIGPVGKGAILQWGLGGVLISLTLAVEPVRGWTTESVTHGQCDNRPTVTFPAAECHRPLAGTKLYCLVTEAHGCEQLAQSCYCLLYTSPSPRD